MTITPIFIFSLPRSGSTLLQTILATHHEIDTTPEPWFLIPIYYSLKDQGIYTEYNHSIAYKAIKDFYNYLPNGKADYYEAIRNFTLDLYNKQSKASKYFVDKTPRYHEISDEIIETFPEAKFIFLFRNPMAILSSIISTWNTVHIFKFDLIKGLEKLLKAATSENVDAHLIKYEDLVNHPEQSIKILCQYLGIKFADDMVKKIDLSVIPDGSYGKPLTAGNDNNQSDNKIHSDSINKWNNNLSKNWLRRVYARKYLDWIGEEHLKIMGYNYKSIKADLYSKRLSYKFLFSDVRMFIRGFISTFFEVYIFREKVKLLPYVRKIFPHQ